MKNFIKQKLREQIIDNQEMDEATQAICNKMTVNNYSEVVKYVEAAMKGFNEETRIRLMQKIHVPLENLRQEQIKIDNEVKTSHMSGDSMPDQANTYWHQIQNVLCELGQHFK